MCELCELKVIEEEFYRDDDFVIISCMNCHVPMVVPFEHIDPRQDGSEQLGMYALTAINRESFQRLTRRMEEQLTAVALDFYEEDECFYIDKKERSILDHMHWHARKIGD